MVEWIFLMVPRGYLQFVIVVFPNHTHYFALNSLVSQPDNETTFERETNSSVFIETGAALNSLVCQPDVETIEHICKKTTFNILLTF